MIAWSAKFRWKISTRLAGNTVLISSVALAVFAYMIVQRLDFGILQQKMAIEQLTSDRLFQRLDLHAKYIENELEHLRKDSHEVGLRLSSSSTLRNYIETDSVLGVGRVLKRMAKTTEFDSLIILDMHARIIGAHDPRLINDNALAALESMSMLARSRGIIYGHSTSLPISYSGFEVGHESDLRAIGIETSTDQLVIVSLFPLTDESGKTVATFIGHRVIPPDEPSLAQIDDDGRIGISILTPDNTVFSTGSNKLSHDSHRHINMEKLGATSDGHLIFKCRPFDTGWLLCVHILEADYQHSIDQLVKFVKDENYALVGWLVSLTFVIIFLSVISTWVMSQKILEPLYRITRVVHDVAKGNWLARVPGIKRTDEVGEIARAVLVLQQSMKDRERLQSDVDNINEARSRRVELKNELENTQTVIRKRLFNLSDLAERLEQNNKKLTESATDAVGEVDESRLVASRAGEAWSKQQIEPLPSGGGANDVVESIDRLGETLSSIYTRTYSVSEDVNRLLHETQSIDRIVKDLNVTIQKGVLPHGPNKKRVDSQKLIELKGESVPPIGGNCSTG